MNRRTRSFAWLVAALLIAAGGVYVFRPSPVLVDAAVVRRGTLRVTVDDEGRTRVRDKFTVSAPIRGRLLRVPVHAGDDVEAGRTVVAELLPAASEPLDVRSRLEAAVRVERAEAALKEAEARRAQGDADLRYARTMLARTRRLQSKDAATREELDGALRGQDVAVEALSAAEQAVDVARHELDLARAALLETSELDSMRAPDTVPDATNKPGVDGDSSPSREAAEQKLLLRSPIDGKVLRLFEESARTLQPGAPILDVGDTDVLEIVAEYLSQDAMKIAPGMEAIVEGWGGELPGGREKPLRGRVRLVEPGGFTKTSALGVEEQRVNVIVDPAAEGERWARLGDGYRVELVIVVWEGNDVLVVPTGALFRDGEAWAVYRIDAGRARKTGVSIGRMGGLAAEVLEGLGEGDRVVMYPSELIGDGMRVQTR
jgi:HlyD family secretion protein